MILAFFSHHTSFTGFVKLAARRNTFVAQRSRTGNRRRLRCAATEPGTRVHVTLLTDHPGGAAAVLPALQRLDVTSSAAALGDAHVSGSADCVMVDVSGDLTAAVAACRSDQLRSLQVPVLVVAPSHTLAVLKASWGFEDWVLPDCGAAELSTRLRLAVELHTGGKATTGAGGLELDADSYRVTAHGQVLDLTYTEFELLRTLMDRPNHAWTRGSLLRDAWGYEHAGGTRTVDVHIRRLRAKLGPELAAAIQTVRKVGYKLVLPPLPDQDAQRAPLSGGGRSRT